MSNYKLYNNLTGYSISSIINNLINKFTQKNLIIYNSNIKNFNVAISNFHSFLTLNKINREILNKEFWVLRNKLLFTISYDNIINLNIE